MLGRTLILLGLFCLSQPAHAADEQCEGEQCADGDKPAKSPTPGRKNKYQKPGQKKNKYQRPGAKKNKYQRPGAKKNKYQRKNKYQKSGTADDMGDYSFDDPTANHMQMGIKFDESKKPDLSIKAFEAAVKFQGT